MPRHEASDPVVVVGAGAAGLLAAIFAASGARPVILLEATQRPGQKILISGGGRCNVLPSAESPSDFVTDGSPNTLRKIFNTWPLDQVRRFFEVDLGVPLQLEAATGKLFPAANRARVVLDALLGRAGEMGVGVRAGARVTGLARSPGWQVRLSTGETISASRIVLATGGLSVPATGSDGLGLRLAEESGHSLVPPYPALVPLTTEDLGHRALAGISLVATLETQASPSARPLRSQGGFLFTHRGYSGPAVLNISHIPVRSTFTGGPRPPVWVKWTTLNAAGWEAVLQRTRGPILALLRGHLPERLAAQLLSEAGLTDVEGSQLTREDRRRIVQMLVRYRLPWQGHEGYRTAEVTGGGVPLSEVDPATLESRMASGLYLCGEILDAFGPIGGYNFLWAWITGRLAGRAAGMGDTSN
jgi:predicted Rossmann fold flavoprotein